MTPITKMIAALRGLGLPAVPAARIGETAPKLPGELPAVRVVASELAFAPLGIGGSRVARLDADANWVEDKARRITGVLNVEVWGADEDAVNILALAVAEGLAGIETDMLAAGFLRLRQSRWRDAEEAPLRGVQDGKALKQALAYDIVFEDVETAPADEGVIQRIDIRVKPPVEEDFDVRKGRDVP